MALRMVLKGLLLVNYENWSIERMTEIAVTKHLVSRSYVHDVAAKG